jgi:Zn-dependent metalloprotease
VSLVDNVTGDPTEFVGPTEGLVVNRPCPAEDPPRTGPDRSMSAALDIIAHEWGHGVDYHGSGRFAARCIDADATTHEVCQIKEGFADVIGHIVEWNVHTNPGVGQYDDDYTSHPEQRDWVAGEDFDPANVFWGLRRADRYDDDHSCAAHSYHYSVHADDAACEPAYASVMHNAGNRLSVVLRLLALGGPNPGCGQVGNCNLVVQGIGMPDASRILFRILTVQADVSTVEWDQLPFLGLHAALDLFESEDPPCALSYQEAVWNAFRAVGYPGPPYSTQLPYLCYE